MPPRATRGRRGKVGVCLVTSGPAATNLVTALQDALMDSIPIVAFTGQVPTHLIGNDAFQEADNVGITRLVHQAQLPREGRPRPRAHDQGGVPHRGHRAAGAGPRRPAQGHARQGVADRVPDRCAPAVLQPHLRRATPGRSRRRRAPWCAPSGRCSTWAAGAISADAAPALRELAELARSPVTQTLMGLGAFPMDHPLSLDMLGMHGTLLREHGGASFRPPRRDRGALRRPGDRAGRCLRAERGDHPHRHRPLVDLEEHQGPHPDRGRLPAVCSRGWWRRCARSCGQEVPPAVREGRRQWAEQIAEWKRQLSASLRVERQRHQAPARDPGDLEPDPGRGLSSSPGSASTRCGRPSTTGSSTRGTGAPRAASAPWATDCPPPWACRPAHPGQPVINIDGDGSFAMNSQELATCFDRGPAGEDRDHQQQRARHGAAVAADHLQGALSAPST